MTQSPYSHYSPYPTKEAARVSQLQLQSYMPQGNKRKLTDKELKDIEDKSSRILPTIFTSNATPITEAMYSPGTSSVLMGLLGGGLGAGTGLLANQALSGGNRHELAPNAPLAALLGGLAGAGLGGLSGYFGGKARNEGYADAMTRLPVDANLRDYYGDPLIQRELDREIERTRNIAFMM